MKIKKDSSGKTYLEVLPNQTIIYDPEIDCYIIETEVDGPIGSQLYVSKIPSSILSQLYNESNGLLDQLLDAPLAVENFKK